MRNRIMLVIMMAGMMAGVYHEDTDYVLWTFVANAVIFAVTKIIGIFRD